MSTALDLQSFSPPTTHVYNPLNYAWDAHEWYVRQYGNSRKRVLLVGMNPGPWGMAQTGVPFGQVSAVRDFLKMPPDISIGRPLKPNAARPVQGLSCERSEVSGRRLWCEWAQTDYGSAREFFATFFVHNYCPLMFMEKGGRNRTPVQLKATERVGIEEVCDVGLREVVRAVEPRLVCAIGGFAEKRCRLALHGHEFEAVRIGKVLHPSPASPLANRGWVEAMREQMGALMDNLPE